MNEQQTLSDVSAESRGQQQDWDEVPFVSLIADIRNGLYKKKEYYGEGVQIAKMGELFDGDFVTNEPSMDRLELSDKELEKHGLEPGDLLFARRSFDRAGAGKCSIVTDLEEPLVPESSIIRARLNREKADPRFYAYYFQSSLGKGRIGQFIRQTAVSGIAQSDLKEIQVPHPPKEVQERIANNIELFDEKIRVNKNLNETLEDIIEAVFRDRYVDLGRTHGLKSSEVGEIPEDWRAGTLGELMEKLTDSIDADEAPDSKPYIGLKHMPKESISLDSWGKAEEVSSRKYDFQKGQILFGRLRPYFCKVGIAPITGISSTDIQIIEPKKGEIWKEFLVCYLSDRDFINYCEKVSTGTRMPRVSWDDMCEYQIPIPPEEEIKSFHDFTSPIFEKIMRNIHEAQKMKAVRDTLLPKLMAGEVQARDINLEDISDSSGV